MAVHRSQLQESARGQGMKSQDLKTSHAKTGVSRVWLGFAAVAGAAFAYLGDPERGNARRQAALRQLSGVTQALAERTSGWRKSISARLPGRGDSQLPAQVTVPSEPAAAATTAETTKPEL